jgi:hypothetical protein
MGAVTTDAPALAGTPADWTRARELVDELAEVRANEAKLSAEFDTLLSTLTKAGNTGHVIAKELDIARTTVSRATRRAGA